MLSRKRFNAMHGWIFFRRQAASDSELSAASGENSFAAVMKHAADKDDVMTFGCGSELCSLEQQA